MRDLSNITQALKILLVLNGLVVLLCLWSELAQLGLLERIAAEAEWTPEEADANDFRQFLIGSFALVVNVATAIVFLRWLFLASRNAHEVTAGMEFKPGWTVGWYFIPILGWWKPYQAMAELFRASDPAAGEIWQLGKRPAFLPVWWLFWVVSSIVGNAIFRRLFDSDTLDELILLSQVTAYSYLVDIVLAVLAFMLVTRLTEFQDAKFRAAFTSPRLATGASS